jgi:nucleotide-binding universal stress UspA family protein
MSAYRHLLCATDFSEASAVASAAATRLAERLGARTTLLHVVDAGAVVPGLDISALGDPKKIRAAEGKKELEAMRRSFADPAMVDVACVVAKSVAAGILEHLGAVATIDLCVVGTHGRAGLQRLVMGSVAEKVVRGARCDVLTVGPRCSADAPVSGVVLVGTDFSEDARYAYAPAAELARALGAEVVLAHVDEGTPVAADEGHLASKDAVTAALLEALEEDRKLGFAGATARTELLEADSAAEGMVALAERLEPAMLVVASHGRSGLTSLLIGSVAERLVRSASCPVLTVRVRGS